MSQLVGISIGNEQFHIIKYTANLNENKNKRPRDRRKLIFVFTYYEQIRTSCWSRRKQRDRIILPLSLADSAALSSTPRESSLSNSCRSRLSTRSISSFFLPNLSLFPPSYPVSLSLFISLSLPFDHRVYSTTRADHNTRYPWRRVLSPFTQFVFQCPSVSIYLNFFILLIHLHPRVYCRIATTHTS